MAVIYSVTDNIKDKTPSLIRHEIHYGHKKLAEIGPRGQSQNFLA
jgi:hypothetical protein